MSYKHNEKKTFKQREKDKKPPKHLQFNQWNFENAQNFTLDLLVYKSTYDEAINLKKLPYNFFCVSLYFISYALKMRFGY